MNLQPNIPNPAPKTVIIITTKMAILCIESDFVTDELSPENINIHVYIECAKTKRKQNALTEYAFPELHATITN